MADDKKKGLLLAIGMKPKGGDDEPEPDEDEGSEGDEAAAGEALDAIKAGDAAGLAKALRDFVDIAKG